MNNSKYKSNLIFSLILFFGFLTVTINDSCNTTEPTPPQQEEPDTTSHSFTWQTFEFGDDGASPSSLKDVAIINDSDIWAVGSVYLNDSTGQPDYTTYNAVHWDGNQWELKRIFFPTVCGSSNLTSYPAKAIFAFEDGQIWISSSGDKIAILKDGVQVDKFCLPSNVSMAINKIWGISKLKLVCSGK